ncbi:MAG TPA: nodulation protein NfeD [Gammaproteobacteria bacterium]|jgi:membrane-bound serine protease (ClpP class)|nr:nodulation protein NfeD [Gammaproteobacteria bacterium]
MSFELSASRFLFSQAGAQFRQYKSTVLLLFVILSLRLFNPVWGDVTTALIIEIDGAISPATSNFIEKGLNHGNENGVELIVIEMDTPGGLDTSMRSIIKNILNSKVPVATYVSPKGSRAASAGTFILYASHIAAMAPATNLGAATPVAIGGTAPSPIKPEPVEPEDKEENKSEPLESTPDNETALAKKRLNDAAAYIRSLADRYGRNAEWAELAVREAATLTAEEALENNVIDYVADDLGDLFEQINGHEVETNAGKQTLSTENVLIERFIKDWRIKFLETLADPNLAYLLMLIGIYGLILEGYNPGSILPGVVGAICLILALFAFQVLAVNYAGLILIALGVVLIVAEAFAPSFGILGFGGLTSFVLGSIMLFDSGIPGFEVSRLLIGSIAFLGGLIILGLVFFLARTLKRPIVSGTEGMLGEQGIALEDFDSKGDVLVHGERWQAKTSEPVKKGQGIEITAVKNMLVLIKPTEEG